MKASQNADHDQAAFQHFFPGTGGGSSIGLSGSDLVRYIAAQIYTQGNVGRLGTEDQQFELSFKCRDVCDPKCEGRTVFVERGIFRRIFRRGYAPLVNICPAFWDNPNSDDLRIGFIIHEWSHIWAGTEDDNAYPEIGSGPAPDHWPNPSNYGESGPVLQGDDAISNPSNFGNYTSFGYN